MQSAIRRLLSRRAATVAWSSEHQLATELWADDEALDTLRVGAREVRLPSGARVDLGGVEHDPPELCELKLFGTTKALEQLLGYMETVDEVSDARYRAQGSLVVCNGFSDALASAVSRTDGLVQLFMYELDETGHTTLIRVDVDTYRDLLEP